MPGVPFAAFLVALVAALAVSRRGLLAVLLALAAWSAVVASALWHDPHAANDCALLLARSAIADGNVYVPNLFLRTWAEGAPGLWVRIAAWLCLTAALASWIHRSARGRAGRRPVAALFGFAAAILGTAAVLERWPGGRRAARFPDALEVAPGTTAFVEGAQLDGGRAWLAAGEHTVLVRSRDDVQAVRVRVHGEGFLRLQGRPPLPVTPRGIELDLRLDPLIALEGRRGVGETLRRQRFELDAPGGGRFLLAPAVR
jgi:hypothetical protein